MKIHIYPKNQLSKGIIIMGYIHPNSSYSTLMLNGLSIKDITALRDYQLNGFVNNNSICIDLNIYNYSVLD